MSYRKRLRAVLKIRCVHLCTKAAFQPLPDEDELANPYDTAAWWCARTTEALGPDGSAAADGDCDGPGRECYEGPAGAPTP